MSFEEFARDFGSVAGAEMEYEGLAYHYMTAKDYDSWMRTVNLVQVKTWKDLRANVRAKLKATASYLCTDMLYEAFEGGRQPTTYLRDLDVSSPEVNRFVQTMDAFEGDLREYLSPRAPVGHDDRHSTRRMYRHLPAVDPTSGVDHDNTRQGVLRSKMFLATLKDAEALVKTAEHRSATLEGGGRDNGAAAMFIVVAAAMVFALA